MERGTFVKVPKLPACDICGEPAHYDARSYDGRWGFFCERDFHAYTDGRLGVGFGQKLIVEDKQ